MDYYVRFVFTILITGGFRIGVSQKLMTKALAKATDLDEDILAYKLMGNWDPNTISFQKLVLEENKSDYLSKPFPFYLAYALEDTPDNLGAIENWYVEHKWDGIRSQVIVRNDELFVWSRGEELVTDKYPEFHSFIGEIPNGTVMDGEILPFPNGDIGTFNDLQTRIGRKTISKALLKKTPVILKVYDILEWEGKDIRKLPFSERRRILEALVRHLVENTDLPLQLSETMEFSHWDEIGQERERSREVKSEGLMLKRKDSPYLVGRKKGDWWKWKVDPLTIDAVLTYAMRGHGRRSNLFTDYTFALWDQNEKGEKELVTFAKAYSGLTDAEFRKIDAWIKKNTLERFGPVRSVTPHQVFEIAFEGIAISKRHKSGVATRFPRILRWRTDKKIEEANTLIDLKALIPGPISNND
jgi:DNA ligase-1